MRRNGLITLFTVAYATLFGMITACFLNLCIGYAFGITRFLKEHPRFAPFCSIVVMLGGLALICVFAINLKLSKKLNYKGITWVVEIICSFLLSIPMFFLFIHLLNIATRIF